LVVPGEPVLLKPEGLKLAMPGRLGMAGQVAVEDAERVVRLEAEVFGVLIGAVVVVARPQLVELVRAERLGVADDRVVVLRIGVVGAHEDVARRRLVVVALLHRPAEERGGRAAQLVVETQIARIDVLRDDVVLDVVVGEAGPVRQRPDVGDPA
jgi:hypothetical protein